MDSQTGSMIGCVFAGVAVGLSLVHMFPKRSVPSSKPKLVYFDGRGLAEVARQMMVCAGVDYDEIRYAIRLAPGDGPVMSRLSKAEMDADAKAGKFVANMGRVPLLEISPGKEIGGSKAIYRYLANTYGLNGKCAFEAAKIDSICEMVWDVSGDFDKAEDKERFLSVSVADGSQQGSRGLKYYLTQLEKVVGDNGYAVGNSFSMADAIIYSKFGETALTKGLFGPPLSEPMKNAKAVNAAMAECSPSIHKIVRNWENCAAIKSYLKVRNSKDMLF